jgi:iron complex transport system ATP-binding protein
MLHVNNISFSYANKDILQDISFTIQEGDIISLLGPNGAGKSTLIKIMLGLLKPKSGAVYIQNKDINTYKPKELAKRVAYVPQSSYLPFSYTTLEVVIMGRISYQSIFSKYSKKDEDVALESLQTLGIADLKDRPYNELSGGQKQLVLIARALSQEAKVFIMDEPVSGLDYGNQLRLLETLQRLSAQGFTFLKSTHYPDHAFLVSNEVILMKDGKIVEKGSTQKVINQKSIYDLYGIDVDIESSTKGYSMCVPKFTRGKFL